MKKIYPMITLVIISSVILLISFKITDNKAVESINNETYSEADIKTTVTEKVITSDTKINIKNTDASENTTVIENTKDTLFQNVDNSYFNDALFIGDSRTVGLYLYGSITKDAPDAIFFADVGLTVDDAINNTILVPPESGNYLSLSWLLNNKKFSKVYIMLGINEVGTGTPETFSEQYSKLINIIHESLPEATIYIQSMISITNDRNSKGDCINIDNINSRNNAIKNLANNNYIYYLDINEILTDSNGFLKNDLTSDGVHLKSSSLSLWEDYLKKHVSK